MTDIPIPIKGTENLLKNLDPNKASGPDVISPKLIKEMHHGIEPILTTIFRSPLPSSILPEICSWCPCLRKDKCKHSNYRPISLTCIVAKVMEHIQVSNAMTHFNFRNLLSPFQHGFRSKHICGTQLISFFQEIIGYLENGKQTGLIIMDFSKAFDKVDHNLSVYKFFNMGIKLKTASWSK